MVLWCGEAWAQGPAAERWARKKGREEVWFAKHRGSWQDLWRKSGVWLKGGVKIPYPPWLGQGSCSGWWSRVRTQGLLGQSNAGDTCSASGQANCWEKHGVRETRGVAGREKPAVCHWTGQHLSLGPSFGDCSVAPSLPGRLGQRRALVLLMLSLFPANE